MTLSKWVKGVVNWVKDGIAYVSVPFTWYLPKAYEICTFWGLVCKVKAGGPAVDLMPDFLSNVSEVGGKVDALRYHNPDAVFTSRGCIRKCRFCAVPKIEGDLVELKSWEPKPIVCDNNLLACSKKHFDKVIDSLKNVPNVDFNQGLDARLLTNYHADRLAELDIFSVRLAWDSVGYETQVMSAIEKLRKSGIKKTKIRVYVLIGFKDTMQDARYRLETLKNMGVLINPMRYNPLNTLRRDSYIAPGWTDRDLRRFMSYWSMLVRFRGIPFDEYIYDELDGIIELKGKCSQTKQITLF